jgi:hypothetical protein
MEDVYTQQQRNNSNNNALIIINVIQPKQQWILEIVQRQ